MKGYSMCVAGRLICQAQQCVTQLKHLGCRLFQAKLSPGGGEAGLRLQRDMLQLADELWSLARQIREEVAKVVFKL